MVLDKINIEFENNNYLPEEKETYQIGEEINEKIKQFLLSGMAKGDLRSDLELMPAIFNFWGMLSGIIQLAANKTISENPWDYRKISLWNMDFLLFTIRLQSDERSDRTVDMNPAVIKKQNLQAERKAWG